MKDKQIDNYALNKMSAVEKELFEKEIETKIELAEEVQFIKQLVNTVEHQKLVETKLRIKEATAVWRNNVPELNSKLIDTESIMKSLENIAEPIIHLIAHFFKPYSAAYRNAAIEQLNIEDKAFYFYNKKEYVKAIPLLLKLSKDDNEVQLMIGNAYASQQDYQAAYPFFKQLIDDESVFYLNEAYWYTAICLIGLNRFDEAATHLQYLLDNKKTSKKMQENASALLQKLSHQT